MNQCTSQVNPGEIEIHLQTSDHNQWWRKHMEAGLPQLQTCRPVAQWGTTVEGKAEKITSQTLCAPLWEVLVACKKVHVD